MFVGCRSIGFLGILDSINSRDFSDSFSFSIILTTSLFMDLIFFLLNLALVLWDVLVILFSNPSIWDFELLISVDKTLNFLASLEFLFLLCFSCLLVRGTSGSDRSNSQVGIRGGSTLLSRHCRLSSLFCSSFCSSFWRKAINSAFLNQE